MFVNHKFLSIILLLVVLSDHSYGYPQHQPQQNDSMIKKISDCFHSGDSLLCLKKHTLNALQDAIASERPISVSGYFDIVRDENFKTVDPTENEIESKALENPSMNSTARNMVLDDMLVQKFDQFLQSRSLKISLAPVIEGRKKKDQKGGMIMMAGLAMAGMMAQMAMGKIAFMAGAALIIAKIALLMSTLIGLKKLVGSSGGSEHVVVTAAAPSSDHGHSGYSGGGGWQRSLNAENIGSLLAYRAYAPVYDSANNSSNPVEQK